MYRIKHAFYIRSNKSSTYLARTLKSINKSFKPIKLKWARNTYTSNPLKIMQKFGSSLSSLYPETNKFNPKEADSFFSRINLPQISSSHKNHLDELITIEDVMAAIKDLKINKRLGPRWVYSTILSHFCRHYFPYVGTCIY